MVQGYRSLGMGFGPVEIEEATLETPSGVKEPAQLLYTI
jgi:hypothetical protein